MPLGFNLAEIAPAAPALEALPILLALAGLIFALGLIKLVHGFVHAMFWGIEKGVGWIPFAKKVVKVPIHKIEQRISHWLGEAEQSIDNYIGWCFHNMAALVRQAAREIEGLAHDLWLLGAVIPTLVSRLGLKYLVAGLKAEIKAWLHLIHWAARKLGIEQKKTDQAIRSRIHPQLRANTAAIDRVIEWDIPRLRARERALGRDLANLRKWVRARTKVVATTAFIAATATALRRMKLGWLRCRNWKRFGPAICHMHARDFDLLLATLVGAAALADYRELIREMQAVERKAAQEIIDLLHAFD